MQCGICKVKIEEVDTPAWMNPVEPLVEIGKCLLCDSIFYMFVFQGVAYIIEEADLLEMNRRLSSYHNLGLFIILEMIAVRKFAVN